MKLNITKKQALSTLKVAIYIAVSAAISYLITVLTDQPDLLGIYTPIVNMVLVVLKKLVTTEQ